MWYTERDVFVAMYYIILQRLALEAFLDLLYFPLWWYTCGLKHAALACLEWLKVGNARLAPGLWLKNILVPMYGQYDLTGKMVSFVMRLIQVIFRSIVLFFFAIGCGLLLAVWILLPLLTIAMLLTSLLRLI